MIGRCFCGSVAFEFFAPLSGIELCHCSRCQRASGAPFVAEFRVEAGKFRWLRGKDLIATFDAPILRDPPAYRRSFCKTCGAAVPSVFENNPTVAIPTGSVEGDLETSAMDHIWIKQKANWLDLSALGTLPQHEGDPPH